ncbi:hypothetical protein [Dongia sp.]|uniref:hypothetical protein n=1 Tax=Dongia sp. TaxID=1977262 RepID=UPI0035B04C93
MTSLSSETGTPEETSREASQPDGGKTAANATKARQNNMLVMALLGLDVVLGTGFGTAGYFLLESPAIALAGAAFTTVGLILMLIFQLVGRER